LKEDTERKNNFSLIHRPYTRVASKTGKIHRMKAVFATQSTEWRFAFQ